MSPLGPLHKILARTELRDRNPLSWGNYLIADSDTQFLYVQFLHKANTKYTLASRSCERSFGILVSRCSQRLTKPRRDFADCALM